MTNIKIKSTKPVEQKRVASIPKKQEESLIMRVLGIIVMDIKGWFYGNKMRKDNTKEWQDYERFCKLARGER